MLHHGFARTSPTHFFDNPTWRAAAAESFDASIIWPRNCILNLNAPMAAGPLHTDQPIYRGMGRPETPVWLLNVMTYSGLFNQWLVPIASGLAWFYTGKGGELDYWPNGLEEKPCRLPPPLWNEGLMSDNEFMYHRVGPIGPAERWLDNRLYASAMLHHVGSDSWEIRDGNTLVAFLQPDELRISLLWKA